MGPKVFAVGIFIVLQTFSHQPVVLLAGSIVMAIGIAGIILDK